MAIVVILALVGGGMVYYRVSEQRKAETAELAARKEAEAQAERAREAAAQEAKAARKEAEAAPVRRLRERPGWRRNAEPPKRPPKNSRRSRRK